MKAQRVKSIIRLIECNSLEGWTPRGRNQHMKKFGVSRKTADADFDTAINQVRTKRQS